MKKRVTMTAMLLVLPLVAQAGGDHEHGHMHEAGKTQGEAHEHAHASPAGMPGKASEVTRTIDVVMNDTMRFDPEDLRVRPGETVRFRIRNEGRIRHEMVLGTQEEIREHLEMMRAMPDMRHQDANAISLAPGESGELIWKFGQGGTVDFACMVPGHYEAGMKGEIHVVNSDRGE